MMDCVIVVDQMGVDDAGAYTAMEWLNPFAILEPSSVISTDSSVVSMVSGTSQTGALVVPYKESLWLFSTQPAAVCCAWEDTLA